MIANSTRFRTGVLHGDEVAVEFIRSGGAGAADAVRGVGKFLAGDGVLGQGRIAKKPPPGG